MKRLLYYITCLLVACTPQPVKEKAAVVPREEPVHIPALVKLVTDTSLHLQNGVWYCSGKLFSGTIETYYGKGVLKCRQTFYNGKEEGLQATWYENGQKDAERFYHNGEKDGIHRGWYNNGNLRFEYHFTNGLYEGDFKEWYASGKPLKQIVYQGGHETSGKGWRENGKPYMSFVVRDGRMYGLVNPNLCYSLKNERGEFVNSSK